MSILTPEEFTKMVPFLDGKLGVAITRFLFQALSVNKINDCYDSIPDKTGPDFARAAFAAQNIDYQIGHSERLKSLPDGPFITISNHPYGHIDGIMLIDIFGHLRRDYKIMVNQLLAIIRKLDENFITVVPTGAVRTAPKKESITGVRAAMEHLSNGGCMGFFPSGAVSDLSLRDRCIRDRQWQNSALRLIRRAEVPIIPVRFFDRNSIFYYLLGLIDYRVRLLRLPAEAMNKSGKTIRLGIGETIGLESQKQCGSLEEFGTMLRRSVYDMPMPDTFVSSSQFFEDFDGAADI